MAYSATIPAHTLPKSGGCDDNRTEELRSEMRSLVGAQNDMKFCALVLAMCRRSWKLEETAGNVTIEEFPLTFACKFRFST